MNFKIFYEQEKLHLREKQQGEHFFNFVKHFKRTLSVLIFS